MTPTSLVARGQKLEIAAGTWNDVLRMLADWRRGPALHTPGVRGGIDAQLEIFVRNDTGAALPEFSVLGINDGTPLVSAVDLPFEFLRGPVFTGIEPVLDTDQPAVTLEPIPAGQIGRAAVGGVAVCTVDVYSPTTPVGTRAGDYVKCVPNTTRFIKSTAGTARLLWYKPTSTGDTGPRRGVVLLGADAPVLYDLVEVVTAVTCVGGNVVGTLRTVAVVRVPA